jgi:hypothetical protein
MSNVIQHIINNNIENKYSNEKNMAVCVNKKIIISFIFLTMVLQIYAQDNTKAYYVNKCISLLGGSVPEGFQRMNRNFYMNDEDIVLYVENGVVLMSSFGSVFLRTNEAYAYSSSFYDYFETNNWVFIRTINGSDIYLKNGVYVSIVGQQRRSDGLISSTISFGRDINVFF